MHENGKSVRGRSALAVVLAVLLIFTLVVMAVSSRKPAPLSLGDLPKGIKGAAFITTNKMIIDQMLRNWLPNDIFWPTALLDNMPNFQIGQLEVIRYNVRVLRDNLSRMRTTDSLDPLAEAAFTALSNDPFKWWFPSAEDKWKDASKALEIYMQNIGQGKSFFYPRADNLAELLQQYASLMGGVNTRLINAPPDKKAVMAVDESDKGQVVAMVDINIPWRRIDDNFYYAQGVAYALYHSFAAIRNDFINVLNDKNSVRLVDKILESLGRCDFEPILVLNRSPGSLLANHSMNLSALFNDARQKVESLVIALSQG